MTSLLEWFETIKDGSDLKLYDIEKTDNTFSIIRKDNDLNKSYETYINDINLLMGKIIEDNIKIGIDDIGKIKYCILYIKLIALKNEFAGYHQLNSSVSELFNAQ